jgi:hypothetical protein
VPHDRLFADPSALPTFNSNAIEANLHRIPDLGPRFLYFNDDVFLGREIERSHFIDADGTHRVFHETWYMPLSGGPVHDLASQWTLRLFDARPTPRLSTAHVPQLLDRARLTRLAERFAHEVARTSTHRFRSPEDVVLRVLYFQSLPLEGDGLRWRRIVLRSGTLEYAFLMMVDDHARMRAELARLLALRPRFFCINDDLPDVPPDHPVLTALRATLDEMFPEPCEFER